MKEQESWGQLSKVQFSKFYHKFVKTYGKPITRKRLAISFWDPKIGKNVDTRIRITDGKPQIVQKLGRWARTKKWKFTETFLDLPSDVDQIFNTYKILRNLVRRNDSCRFIQHKNYIFETENFEIKLSKQFGKITKYVFEVELKKPGKHLQKIVKSLGLYKYTKETDTDFWEKWNKTTNLTDEELKEEGVRKLIRKYLLN